VFSFPLGVGALEVFYGVFVEDSEPQGLKPLSLWGCLIAGDESPAYRSRYSLMVESSKATLISCVCLSIRRRGLGSLLWCLRRRRIPQGLKPLSLWGLCVAGDESPAYRSRYSLMVESSKATLISCVCLSIRRRGLGSLLWRLRGRPIPQGLKPLSLWGG
jgi:hypothetical protein